MSKNEPINPQSENLSSKPATPEQKVEKIEVSAASSILTEKKRGVCIRLISFFLKVLRWFFNKQGITVTIATIVGVFIGTIPVYFTYWWQSEDLTAIVTDFLGPSNTGRTGVTVVFENRGNQKAIISNMFLKLVPATDTKIIPQIMDLPNGGKFTSYGTIPSGTAMVYGKGEIPFHLIPFDMPQTFVINSNETLVRECDVNKEAIQKIVENFTPDSRFSLGLKIVAINSQGQMYEYDLPIVTSENKAMQRITYSQRLPYKVSVYSGVKEGGAMAAFEVQIGTSTPVGIQFPPDFFKPK